MSRHPKFRQNGQTLVEVALVIPVLFGIVLAAVDVSNVLRTRAALEEGVKSTLRCLYPSDGRCVSASSQVGNASFNVRETVYDQIPVADNYNFTFQEHALEGPVLAQNYEAFVLSELVYSYSRYNHSARRDLFRAVGSTLGTPGARNSVASTRMVFVEAFSTQPNNVNFVSRGDRRSYPSANITGTTINSSLQLARQSGSNRRGGYTTVYEFTVPSAPRDLRTDRNGSANSINVANCFLSVSARNENDNLNGTNPSATDCVGETLLRDNRSYTTRRGQQRTFRDFSNSHPNRYRVPAVLYVMGARTGTQSGVMGKAHLRLREVRTGETVTLGAREYGYEAGNSDATFYPRGVASGYTDGDADEFSAHRDKVKVKYGFKYEVQIELEAYAGGGNRTFGWQLDDVELYLPRYGEHEDDGIAGETFDCPVDEGFLPSEIANASSSTIDRCPSPTGEATATISMRTPVEVVSSDHTPVLGSSYTASLPGFSAALDSHLDALGEQYVPNDWVEVVGPMQENDDAVACPNNFGIEGLSSEGTINASAAAITICNPPVPAEAILNATVDIARVSIALSNEEQPRWVQAACNDQSMPSELTTPSAVLEYASHIQLPAVATGTNGRFSLGTTTDPRESVENDARFNCGDYQAVTVGELRPTLEELASLPSDSILKRTHLGPHCEGQLSGSEADSIRYGAISELGLDPDTFLEIGERFSHTVRYPDGVPNSSSNCVAESTALGDVLEIIDIGTFTESELPPEHCQQPGVFCDYEFASIERDENTKTVDLDIAHAADYHGKNEVQAFNPRARYQCEGADCFSIEVLEPGDDGIIRAVGTANVRSMMLMGRDIEVRVEDYERWEGELLDQE